MNLELHKLELLQRVNARIRTGEFHSADELIEKALDALDERAATSASNETGAVVLEALQAQPYTDIDLAPPRGFLSPQHRADAFAQWAASHRDTPLLSDYAVSRESIYEGRDGG